MRRSPPTQPFGQRLVNSMLTLSTMVGQSVHQLTQGTVVGQLGVTDAVFPHPLFHGDTLYTESEVAAQRLSASRPGQGIVAFRHTGRNQDGIIVAQATRTVLMWTRAGHATARTAAGMTDPNHRRGAASLSVRARRCCSAPRTAPTATPRPPPARTP